MFGNIAKALGAALAVAMTVAELVVAAGKVAVTLRGDKAGKGEGHDRTGQTAAANPGDGS